jgi:hypothetical protein
VVRFECTDGGARSLALKERKTTDPFYLASLPHHSIVLLLCDHSSVRVRQNVYTAGRESDRYGVASLLV